MSTTTQTIRRLAADTVGVIRGSDPTSACRWLTGAAMHAGTVARTRSFGPADAHAGRSVSSFRAPSGQTVKLPAGKFGSGRELYIRNVYLRGGATIEDGDVVIDLGANAGVFSVLAAVMGARVISVEAQAGFEVEYDEIASLNRVSDRMTFCAAMIGPADPTIGDVGVLTDDDAWKRASHATHQRTSSLSMPELLDRFRVDRVAVLKMDIEGGEFGVLDPDDDLSWVDRVGAISMEVHPLFGDVAGVASILENRHFTCATTNNDGQAVLPDDPEVQYLYANRKG